MHTKTIKREKQLKNTKVFINKYWGNIKFRIRIQLGIKYQTNKQINLNDLKVSKPRLLKQRDLARSGVFRKTPTF